MCRPLKSKDKSLNKLTRICLTIVLRTLVFRFLIFKASSETNRQQHKMQHKKAPHRKVRTGCLQCKRRRVKVGNNQHLLGSPFLPSFLLLTSNSVTRPNQYAKTAFVTHHIVASRQSLKLLPKPNMLLPSSYRSRKPHLPHLAIPNFPCGTSNCSITGLCQRQSR